MCAKGGNSVCLAGTCSEGQPKLKMFKKRIICRTRLIWARKQDVGGVNQDISRVEGCVLKEEIVFVWLELVQKASPNSKCSRKE